MRCKAVLMTLALALVSLTGCAQQKWISEASYNEFHRRNALPLNAEVDPRLGVEPLTKERPPAPSDVDYPEREIRYLTLAECIATSLENGNTGSTSQSQPGRIVDELFSGNTASGARISGQLVQGGGRGDNPIRVLAMLPAYAGANIDAALARFDAKWVSSINWRVTDQPIQGFNSFSNGDSAGFDSSLLKPLGYGGIAGVTFETVYQNLNSPPRNFPILNPAYTPKARVFFEQPLWQNSGEINQILSRHPGSNASGGAQNFLNSHIAGLGINAPGLLIARVQYDQTRAEFERSVNHMLLNVEVAYWNLYGAFVNLYSSEQALRQSYEAWRISKAKYDAGSIAITQFAQTEGQYQQFRGDRLQALGRVLEAERVLRRLMGLSVEDGKRLVPADSPTLAEYRPNWDVALEETLTLRPELLVARSELKNLQFDLAVARNFLKPDLRLLSSYGVEGLGNRLDGTGQVFDQSIGRFRSSNAFRSLASGHYDSWNIELKFNVPLGYRAEHAGVRRAQLLLAQGYLVVKNEEETARAFLTKAYRDVIESYRVISARQLQRKAFAQQVEARFKEFIAGKTTADFLLEAQRQWANALSSEYQAIVNYNNSLATFQFAKGTIMQHDNVQISEGPLPVCAQVRAVEHERERARAIVLRERAAPVIHPPMSAENGCSGLPALPAATAPRLPALIEGAGPVPQLDALPPVTGSAPKQTQTGRYMGHFYSPPVTESAPKQTTATAPSAGGGPALTTTPAMLATPPRTTARDDGLGLKN